LLSIVVICLILAPIAYFLSVPRSFAGWRPALKWLVASMSVRQEVGGSETQQEPSGAVENSGEAKPTINVPSGEQRTDDTTRSGASPSVAAPQQQDVQPHDARRDDQRLATTAAQSETASLQRSGVGDNSNSCTSKEPVEGDLVLPSKFNRTASYGSKELIKLDAATIGLLVKRGEQLFKSGDLIGARTAFRRAAEAGDADAALAMGSTYDPIEFLALGVQGVDADIIETRRWYETAKRLGSVEASQRLEALVGYY
jgi:TPR repeat protein